MSAVLYRGDPLDRTAEAFRSIAFGAPDGGSEGVSPLFARADHTHAVVAPTYAYYQGYSTGSVALTSLTWTGLVSALSAWTDASSANVTRAGSAFTVALAGLYWVSAWLAVYPNSGGGLYGVRVRRNGATALSEFTDIDQTSADGRRNRVRPAGAVYCAAGDVISFEYVTQNTAFAYGPSTLNSEPEQTAALTIARLT